MATRNPTFVYARMALLGLLFIASVVAGSHSSSRLLEQIEPKVLASTLAIVVVLSPAIVVYVVGVQMINPFSDDSWELPRHDSNPLHLGNPLLIMHFAAYVAIVAGMGYLCSAPWSGRAGVAIGATNLLCGLGFLLGLHWAVRFAKKKLIYDADVMDRIP